MTTAFHRSGRATSRSGNNRLLQPASTLSSSRLRQQQQKSERFPLGLLLSCVILTIMLVQVLLMVVLRFKMSGPLTVLTSSVLVPPLDHNSKQQPSSSRLDPLNLKSKSKSMQSRDQKSTKQHSKYLHIWEHHPNHTSQLPIWIQNYISWHNQMTRQYPGTELFTNPNAPKLLLRSCLGLCGGLHDRLGQLSWDVYLANQTGRMLFLKWERPNAIENFLLPNEFNWTLPSLAILDNLASINQSIATMPTSKKDALDKNIRRHRSIPLLFDGFDETRPEAEFWKTSLDFSIQRATVGEFKDYKILRHRLLGHLEEAILERRLFDLGETDLLHMAPLFGHLFWTFFTPSPGVLAQWNQVNTELNLEAGKYSAVHCRVRHPKATPPGQGFIGKSKTNPADKSGLPWRGQSRAFAISVATKAIYCARALQQKPEPVDDPIYFFSDSNDLVRFMAHELTDPHYRKVNVSSLTNNNTVDVAAWNAIAPIHLVARDSSEENAHIDRQKGREAPAYFGSFVDLLLAIHARCVTYGIGYYAVFAIKISGIKCKQMYHEEEWGKKEGTKDAPRCTEATYQHLLK